MLLPLLYNSLRTAAYTAERFSSKGTSIPVFFSIDTAPATNSRMLIPATAMGSKPTGVRTEKRPPTLSGIINVL